MKPSRREARQPRWSPIADVCMCAGLMAGLVGGLVAAWSLDGVLPGWASMGVLGGAVLVGMFGGGAIGDRIEFGVWWLHG